MRRLVVLAGLGLAGFAAAGPYAAHGPSTANTSFAGWATTATSLVRGPMDIANPAGGFASVGTAASALGARDGSVVSLGDGGSITLGFANPIRNGAGADFAVFENGFAISGTPYIFAELAAVEVSSNGKDFFRFPSVSLTPTDVQLGAFDGLDPTDVHNLAGQFGGGEGTGFDLQDLGGLSSSLDADRATAVRLVDVVGRVDPRYGTRDSLGNLINDPYSTPFASGGFDLDAVGVIYAAPVPEPGTLAALALGVLVVRRRRRASA